MLRFDLLMLAESALRRGESRPRFDPSDIYVPAVALFIVIIVAATWVFLSKERTKRSILDQMANGILSAQEAEQLLRATGDSSRSKSANRSRGQD